jgi:hypothetical protein
VSLLCDFPSIPSPQEGWNPFHVLRIDAFSSLPSQENLLLRICRRLLRLRRNGAQAFRYPFLCLVPFLGYQRLSTLPSWASRLMWAHLSRGQGQNYPRLRRKRIKASMAASPPSSFSASSSSSSSLYPSSCSSIHSPPLLSSKYPSFCCYLRLSSSDSRGQSVQPYRCLFDPSSPHLFPLLAECPIALIGIIRCEPSAFHVIPLMICLLPPLCWHHRHDLHPTRVPCLVHLWHSC